MREGKERDQIQVRLRLAGNAASKGGKRAERRRERRQVRQGEGEELTIQTRRACQTEQGTRASKHQGKAPDGARESRYQCACWTKQGTHASNHHKKPGTSRGSATTGAHANEGEQVTTAAAEEAAESSYNRAECGERRPGASRGGATNERESAKSTSASEEAKLTAHRRANLQTEGEGRHQETRPRAASKEAAVRRVEQAMCRRRGNTPAQRPPGRRTERRGRGQERGAREMRASGLACGRRWGGETQTRSEPSNCDRKSAPERRRIQ